MRSAVPQKQFVAKSLAQVLQLPAHCRLAEETALCSSRYVALFEQHSKVDEEVEIELANMRDSA